MTATTAAAPVVARSRVGWGDLAWLTWRQHRWLLCGTAVVVLGVVLLSLGMAWHTNATGETHVLFGRFGYLGTAQLLVVVPMSFGLLVAAFWSAPLLASEYEQRTHVVVWSQDITPIRWLAGKVVLLGVPAVAMAAGIGAATVTLMNSLNAVSSPHAPFRPFETPAFEAAPQVQVGYAAFGFALGLAFSALTRRTVVAMGLAVGGYFVARVLVSGMWRPYFQEPLRVVEPYSMRESYWTGPDHNTWTVESGYADAAGNDVKYRGGCEGVAGPDIGTATAYEKCLADRGVVSVFRDYHPFDRLVPFQWFEFAIFTVLAAGLLALAFMWVRRSHRV